MEQSMGVPKAGSSATITSHKSMEEANAVETNIEAFEGNFGGQVNANETDRVYIRQVPSEQQQGLDPNTVNTQVQKRVKIHNVWLCYSDSSDFAPEWNPSKNLTGCAQPVDGVIPVQNIRLLVKDSMVFYSENDAFEPIIHGRDVTNSSIFSFNLKPLTFQSSVYYVHVEYEVVPEQGDVMPTEEDGMSLSQADQLNMQNREVQLHAFYVDEINWPQVIFEQDMKNSTATDGIDGASYGYAIMAASIMLGIAAVGAVAILFGVVILAIVKHQQKNRKRRSTELLVPSASE